MDSAEEGTHYLIDRYAILGVERDASAAEITAARNSLAKQWHPDRLHGMAPALQASAERQLGFINEAYELLSDTDKRAAYDKKLEEWKGPVSKDGHPIIDLSADAFSLGSLLECLGQDPGDLERAAQEMIAPYSQFNETVYGLIKQQYESTTTPSAELESAYRAQVEARDLHLTLIEDALRRSIGKPSSIGREAQLEYRAQVSSELDQTIEAALGGLQEQVLLLEQGKQALLPAPEGREAAAISATFTEYSERVRAHVERVGARLKEIAAEREGLLDVRFKASNITYHPDTKAYTNKVIVQVRKEGVIAGSLPFSIKNSTITGAEWDESILEAENGPQRLMADGWTILSFDRVGDIDFMSQLVHVLELHADRMQQETILA
jgi:curved DNA-binding protein CbpA